MEYGWQTANEFLGDSQWVEIGWKNDCLWPYPICQMICL